jgi:hypothetical protein
MTAKSFMSALVAAFRKRQFFKWLHAKWPVSHSLAEYAPHDSQYWEWARRDANVADTTGNLERDR